MNALGDSELRLKVLDKEPQTVEKALNYTTRFEAFEQSVFAAGYSEDAEHNRSRRKVCTVTQDGASVSDVQSLKLQLDQLQDVVIQVTKKMYGLLQHVGGLHAPAMDVSSPTKNAEGNASVNGVDCEPKEAGRAYAIADVYGRPEFVLTTDVIEV